MYTLKERTWNDNWNDVVRDVLWKDAELKALMKIPDDVNILQFKERYLVDGPVVTDTLINEPVRVCVYDKEGLGMRNPKVKGKFKEFDIYVKKEFENDATNDRLKSRAVLIAERIKYLLLRQKFICRLHFNYEDEYDMWTKTIGYRAYHIDFFYTTSV